MEYGCQAKCGVSRDQSSLVFAGLTNEAILIGFIVAGSMIPLKEWNEKGKNDA
jgi:hypothetical protein